MKRTGLALLAATVLLMAGCGAAAEEQKAETPVITGTWATGSWGYEYYGKSQPEYYVQFTDSEIVYLHENGDTLVPDHSNRIKSIEEIGPDRYRIKAESESGYQYTYQTDDDDPDILCYYSTWDENEFPHEYSGGSSLTRQH